jgi:type I restriction enzyme S subunit
LSKWLSQRQGKEKTMNKPTEKGLVPELRFPEFREQGEWAAKQLSELCALQAGKFVRAAEIKENNADGLYPCYGGNGLRGFTATFTHEGKYSLIGRQGALCGNINFVTKKFHATEHAVVVTPKEKINNSWLYYELVRLDLNRFATGQAQPGLSVDNLLKVKSNAPKIEKEQQKIADCLSSLDELLSAHNQKLDALKAHKKGLMQQLFPAEGETVPKLRFPEFREDGDWCFDELGSKTKKVGSGITPKGGDKNYKSAGVPFVRSQNIGWGCLLLDNIAYIEEEVHQSFLGTEIKENDVLLNITGASIGRSAIADQRVTGGNVNQHVCIIRTKLKELHPVYLCQFILSPNGQLQIDSFQAGGNREGLNFAQIRSFSIPIPPNVEEQKKIADGLSSIDELITAQSKKIDALKAHKKGLMQQLFPTVNEVSA